MLELPERIIDQSEAERITATENATGRRQEVKGVFPTRFRITENGAAGYLERDGGFDRRTRSFAVWRQRFLASRTSGFP